MQSNGENEDLPQLELDEVRFRLRGYLQNMVSLISLQIRRAQHPAAVWALEDLRARFAAITGIHVHLDDASDEPIPIEAFLGRFVRTISVHYDPGAQHALSIVIAPVVLSGQRAVLLGQIMVELLINVYRHALVDRTGRIEVTLTAHGDQAMLTIADDGPGLRELAPDEPRFGLSTIESLTKALGGIFTHENRGGLVARVSFPLAEAERGPQPTRGS
jgi:two-component sensor histidine kinase